MSDTYILNLFADLRKQMLNVITSLTKSQLNHIPEGFSNNLHWQIGHVLTITDELIFELSCLGTRIPQVYKTHFAKGTSPANWPGQPPEIALIINNLESQMMDICRQYDGKLAQHVPDKNNFLQASVIGELFHVLIAHESMHLGMITAMAKIV